MFTNQFDTAHLTIPADCEIVFVADFFSSDLVGGAELTSEALIKSSPFKVFKLHSKDVNLQNLESGHSKFWVFGNWAGLNKDLIPTVVANMSYSVLEYDYKYCKYRSPEKHEDIIRATFELLTDLARYLPLERIEKLFLKIETSINGAS